MKLAFYDLETCGLDKDKHGIHQISMILQTDAGQVEHNYFVRPREGSTVSPQALEVCGKTIDELREYPAMPEIHDQLSTVLNLHCDKFNKRDKFFLVGYNNRGFDDNFFRRWFDDCGDKYYGSWFWPNTVDVMVLATQHLMERRPDMENFKLHTVARELGVEVDEARLHDGSYDVLLTKQMYEILTRKEEV